MDSSHPESTPPDDAWREIRRLVEEVARVARTERSPGAFFGCLVDRAVRATGADAAVLWTRTPDGRYQPEFHRHVQRFRLAEDRGAQALHARTLDAAPAVERTLWISAGAGETASRDGARDGFLNREHTLSFTPLRLDAETFAVLELAHPDLDDPALQEACEEIIDAMAESAAAWQRAQRLDELRREVEFAAASDQFARRIHASLSLADTLAEVVNELRAIVPSDRVSVLLADGPRWRVEAISGLDRVDRRSSFVGLLEPLADVVARMGQPLWHEGASHDLPPEVAQPLEALLDASHARTLAVVPLTAPVAASLTASHEDKHQPPEILGLATLEWIACAARPEARTRLERLVRHVAPALQNALEYDTLPGARLLRTLRAFTGAARSRRRRRLRMAAFTLLAVCVVALWPVRFQIVARGQLRPEVVREVFATADGEVAELHVRHEQAVVEGEKLLTLHSPSLDLERERLQGEVETTRERLLAAESARLTDSGKQRDPADSPTLSASEGELRRQLESYEAQLAIVEKQRSALVLASPLGGVVLRSNLLELLQSRPVRRGQMLLAVGDLAGPWQARIEIPDHSVGHVLAAQAARETPLPVAFVLATSPGVKHHGTLASIDQVTNRDEQGQPIVRGVVAFERDATLDARPGATVAAKIDCGRRPLGYVWFHELFEYLQARLFL